MAWTLHAAAKRGPVVTKVPTLAEYLTYWLAEVIKPNREPNTYSQYELFSRRYIIPGLGMKRVDRLTVRDVQTWLNKLPSICRCCVQGKDANRRQDKRRCCAIGQCCHDCPSKRTIQIARDTLRAALGQAWREELVSRNVATMAKLPAARKTTRRGQSWGIDEARRFLESAYADRDPLYPLWVLVLILLAAFDVHPRVAMRILRHSKIAITMELYTMVPDEATLAALKRLSDALGSADAALPDEGE